MPTDTWWKLPDEKRERITAVAMAEFGARGFSAGSLNVIAKNAGIAKGSLFQYFEDKLDFFATMSEAVSTRIEAATLAGVDVEAPFFDVVRSILRRWVTYYRSHPVEQRMSFAAATEVDRDARNAVRSVTNAHYLKALSPIVENAQLRGDVDPDADPALVVSMLVLIMRHLHSAPFEDHGDPAIPFAELSFEETERVAMAYAAALEAAFGRAR
jgi:AcrR family transcriptional regulator